MFSIYFITFNTQQGYGYCVLILHIQTSITTEQDIFYHQVKYILYIPALETGDLDFFKGFLKPLNVIIVNVICYNC